MEKVFDLHIHYLFDIPLEETISIFKEEFALTQTEKGCFLSLPHEVEGNKITTDEMQNLKGLYLKSAFAPDFYAFAGLIHPNSHNDISAVAENFLAQAKEYFSVGFDGIKMLEGYPSLLKAWKLPIDSPVYDKFYAFCEENNFPILMHIANPKENWDITQASQDAIDAGRVYDSSYPTKEEITAQVFRIMDKFPNLKLILAHFGFMSHQIAEAERFMTYPHTCFDVTPGGEQLIHMQQNWQVWLPFWQKYQDRIFYGTDFYAFPKDENWEVSFMRRPKFLREFFETDSTHKYLGEPFSGILLEKDLRDKIYRKNFINLLDVPRKIDFDYMLHQAKQLLLCENHTSSHTRQDLQYILYKLTNA